VNYKRPRVYHLHAKISLSEFIFNKIAIFQIFKFAMILYGRERAKTAIIHR